MRLAWGLNSLVIFRIVQAIAGGILPVITLSILFRIVPKDRFGAAMGMYGLGLVVAPAVGPTLDGYLVQYVDWRLIFFINVPIGILGAVAAALVLPAFPRRVGQRFDVLGLSPSRSIRQRRPDSPCHRTSRCRDRHCAAGHLIIAGSARTVPDQGRSGAQ